MPRPDPGAPLTDGARIDTRQQKKLSKRKGKVNKKKANKKDEVEDVIGADGHLVNTVQARLAALRAVTGACDGN